MFGLRLGLSVRPGVEANAGDDVQVVERLPLILGVDTSVRA
jgi:hypothetical protein